jgi:hypothetical protein
VRRQGRRGAVNGGVASHFGPESRGAVERRAIEQASGCRGFKPEPSAATFAAAPLPGLDGIL